MQTFGSIVRSHIIMKIWNISFPSSNVRCVDFVVPHVIAPDSVSFSVWGRKNENLIFLLLSGRKDFCTSRLNLPIILFQAGALISISLQESSMLSIDHYRSMSR